MRNLVTPNIEALRPYEPGKPVEELSRELGIVGAIKLASNENPLGPSPRALAALRSASSDIHRYPDGGCHRLRAALAQHHRVLPSEILVGAGSNEVIELLVRTFTTSTDHVVFAEPAFVVYRLAAMTQGVPFTAVPLREDTHDLDAMADAVTGTTRLVFIANPNNPTGTYVSREALSRFLDRIPPEVIVALDEAYFDYADAEDYPNGLDFRAQHERLVVLRTFSKIYGLAALRIGYGIGPAGLVEYMNRVRMPFNAGTLAQEAAIAALSDTPHVDESREMNRAERARVSASLREMGVRVAPSQANFVFIDLARAAQPVYEALLRQGVIVRPFAPLPSNLRITIGTPEENDRFLVAIREILG